MQCLSNLSLTWLAVSQVQLSSHCDDCTKKDVFSSQTDVEIISEFQENYILKFEVIEHK